MIISLLLEYLFHASLDCFTPCPQLWYFQIRTKKVKQSQHPKTSVSGRQGMQTNPPPLFPVDYEFCYCPSPVSYCFKLSSFCSALFVEKTILSPLNCLGILVQNQLNIDLLICFWAFISIPLICKFILMSGPQCFDAWSEDFYVTYYLN